MIGAYWRCQDDDGQRKTALKSKVIGSDRGESNERHSEVEKSNLPLRAGSKPPHARRRSFPRCKALREKGKGKHPKRSAQAPSQQHKAPSVS